MSQGSKWVRAGVAIAVMAIVAFMIATAVGDADQPTSRAGAAGELPSWPANSSAWKPIASAPGPRFESATTLMNGRIYSFGSFKDSNFNVDRTYMVYDPVKNTWSTLGTLPTAMAETHLGITDDGRYIYFMGGFKGAIQNTSPSQPVSALVWRYDPQSNSFTQIATMPATSADGGSVKGRGAGGLALIGHTLHYFGGNPADRVTNVGTHFTYNLDTGQWGFAAPMPNPKDHFSTVVLGGKIYALGGEHGHDILHQQQKDAWYYDPATDSWTQIADLPMAKSHLEAASFVSDGRIILAGGQTDTATAVQQPTDEVASYNPVTDSWSVLSPSLPAQRQGVVTERIGKDVVTALGAIQTSQAQANGWTAPLAPVALAPASAPALAAQDLGAAPLNDIVTAQDLSCQVQSGGVAKVYPADGTPADCGTTISDGTTLYTPDFWRHGSNTATPFASEGRSIFTPESQTPVTGSGTASDPYTVTTTVRAGSQLRIAQTETYVAGAPAWTVRMAVTNLTGQPITARLSRAVDCSLGVPDTAFGFADSATAGAGCADTAAHTGAIQALVPEAGANARRLVAAYKTVWNAIDAQNPLPNTCTGCTTKQDNAVALQWDLALAPGASQTVAVNQVVASDGALPVPASPAPGSGAGDGTTPGPGTQAPTVTPLPGGSPADTSTGQSVRGGSMPATCSGRRTIRLQWVIPKHRTIKGSFTVTVGGKRYAVLDGHRRFVSVTLRAGYTRSVKITLRIKTADGRTLSGSQDVTSCTSPSSKAKPKSITLKPLR